MLSLSSRSLAPAPLLALLAVTPLTAGEPPDKLKVFVFSGQSNMVGQGDSRDLPAELREGSERALMFEEGRWQRLRPWRPAPAGLAKWNITEYTFGPEIGFAQALVESWPGEQIGVVKLAIGGTGVLAWHPRWSHERAELTGDGHKGNLWRALTGKIESACADVECDFQALVWMQGGKDMLHETGRDYLRHLSDFVNALRTELESPELPLVLGSYRREGLPEDLSGFEKSRIVAAYEGRPYAYEVLQAQYEAQQALAPARMVPLRDLAPVGDGNGHYGTEGQLELGRLFAEAFLDLVEGGEEAPTAGKAAGARQ